MDSKGRCCSHPASLFVSRPSRGQKTPRNRKKAKLMVKFWSDVTPLGGTVQYDNPSRRNSGNIHIGRTIDIGSLDAAVPGGNLATPIAVAVGALLLGKFFGSAPAAPAKSEVADERASRQPARRPRRPNREIDRRRGRAGGKFLDRPRCESAEFSRDSSARRLVRTR